jgi:PadR family transcriptional regulator PadR
MTERKEILQGTLEMLVLKALTLAPMHGWGIGQRIEQLARGAFTVPQGSLYPALQRMMQKGLLRSEWRVSENNRRARYYRITRVGERHLERETAEWQRTSRAVNSILRAAPAEG